MSRSYRIRNLPSLPGTARKFITGVGRQTINVFDEELWRQVAHDILRLPCKAANHPRKNKKWYGWWWKHIHEEFCIPEHLSKEAHALFDKLEREAVYPVKTVHCHPWVGCWSGAECSRKKWYRQQANRRARRRTNQALHDPNLDLDKVWLPVMDDFFDRWYFI